MTDRTMPPLHLAAALDGAGWHPAAWREPAARPTELFAVSYWVDLVQQAERGLLDFVTFEDSLALQSTRYGAGDEHTDQIRGRLDAVLIAARVAPLTAHIGLIPTTVVTHTRRARRAPCAGCSVCRVPTATQRPDRHRARSPR